MKTLLLSLFCVFSIGNGYAQKGHPSPTPTSASVNTFYAAHQDFQPSLVSRLKVPAGFKVQVAASGLGKPRMMVIGPNNSLYITRRDLYVLNSKLNELSDPTAKPSEEFSLQKVMFHPVK